MVFLNPWGLLALLSIPAILALHFFRDRRRVRRIGGLHLWEFARVKLPAGRRFDRLIRTLPLLFQLIAALILSLLIAGFDWPTRLQARHFTIIADDSISMQARARTNSSAERATQAATKWARDSDRFTLVAAAARPRLLAGPFATRLELVQSLNAWQPEAPVCELESAMNLAMKFAGTTGRVLLLTDDSGTSQSYGPALETHAVGEAAPNAAISFADRLRIAAHRDRVVATIKGYASGASQISIKASIGGQEVASKSIEVPPGQPASLDFEIPDTEHPIRLDISPADALAADDSVVLAAVNVKTVRAYVDDFGEVTDSMRKAIESVPNAYVTDDPRIAELAFMRSAASLPSALRTYRFVDPATSASRMVAQGQQLVLDQRSRITENLTLEGVLWTYAPPPAVSNLTSALISYTSHPLVYTEATQGEARRYAVNLDWQATNLFRSTAWPVMVQGMVEDCRDAIPGMDRTNFRTGEEIQLHLRPMPGLEKMFTLAREGDSKPIAEYQDELPPVLKDLQRGGYSITQGKGSSAKSLAQFQVNLFAPGESDLRNIRPHSADFQKLRADAVAQAGRNRLLFYGLLVAILLATLLSWIYQDAAH
ncbi:MAG: BatA domain-containing protein [Candidatus Sumerlaeaceae bacterium]